MNIRPKDTLEIASSGVADDELILLERGKAFELLADENFLQEWDRLYDSCSWATVFQSRTFVATWYKVYETTCDPILVISKKEGKLTGLLTLTNSFHELGITCAGGRDAYYHTWLANAFNSETFIENALVKLQTSYPGRDILFKYVPTNTPISWLHLNKYWRQRFVLRSFQCPHMDLEDPGLSKLFSKKQFRESCNRLKRLGKLNYECITDIDKFREILDEIATQFDFRKGATFNLCPFRNDPRKKRFLLDLFEQDLLYVAILKLEEEIIASLVATKGKDNFMHGAGMNTHLPIYSKYSPGYLSMVMLGQQLVQEGYKIFDLTPGGHAYKERLANTHREVYELCISNKTKAFFTNVLYDNVKKVGMYSLRSTDIDPRLLRSTCEKHLKRIKAQISVAVHNGILPTMQEVMNDIGQGKALMVCSGKRELLKLNEAKQISINRYSLNDLLDFDEAGGILTKWGFLEVAMKKIELGEVPYTWSQQGCLLACVWYRKTLEGHVLQDFYYHRSLRGEFMSYLSSIINKIMEDSEIIELYAYTWIRDIEIKFALEKVGFKAE